MQDAGAILVDSSVWIQFFRAGHSAEAEVLDGLLRAGPVATCAPIRAEALSGARTSARFQQLQTLFESLVDLGLPDDVWAQVALQRFALARRGHQASLVDLLVAVTAHAHHANLWTLDEGLRRAATYLTVPLYQAAALQP